MKNAFSMIELVFVIVILGILAAIAIPKFAATRDDAQIAKARATIASVRSGIVSERQTRLIKGDSAYIEAGTGANQLDEGGLFGGVLMYSVTDSTNSGNWTNVTRPDINSSTYNYNASGVNVLFTYTRSDGKLDCNTTHATYGEECKLLVN
ncbi:MAG: type II secretion system protein [Sulfurimonas sp.]|nr:type II secretion system protein [Sulfurimonas sp.]MDQ7061298.1 type II secretion system protein [Sulfurimonas sp.]